MENTAHSRDECPHQFEMHTRLVSWLDYDPSIINNYKPEDYFPEHYAHEKREVEGGTQ